MLFPGDWFIESTGERSILDQKKVVTEFNRLQADNRRWSKVADERSMQNCALRQENERLLAALNEIRQLGGDNDLPDAWRIAECAVEQTGDGK